MRTVCEQAVSKRPHWQSGARLMDRQQRPIFNPVSAVQSHSEVFDLHASGLPLAVDRRDSPVLLSQLLSGAASDHHNVQITQRLGHLNPFRPLVRSYLGLGGIATSSARIVAAIAAARPVTHLAPPSWPLKA